MADYYFNDDGGGTGEWVENHNYVPRRGFGKDQEDRAAYRDPHHCPRCQADLVQRTNSRTQAKFVGCSNFPKCKYSRTGELHQPERIIMVGIADLPPM